MLQSAREKAVVGNPENFWTWSPNGWDLTHPATPDSEPVPNSFQLECEISNVLLDPIKTALIIIDMQNVSLNKAFGSPPPNMIAAEKALLNHAIPAARKLRLQIIWLNWGLTETDVANMMPSGMRVFGFRANSHHADYGLSQRKGDPTDPENFLRIGESPKPNAVPGAEMGKVMLEDGREVDAGRKMMRGTWNTLLHDPLAAAFEESKSTPRPDVLIHKNRNSGLWDSSTDCNQFLKENGIRSLLFAGVNTDQCVVGMLQDAHARGFDTVMLKDGCATDSPEYAQGTAEYNACRNWGFLTSCKALAKAAGI